MFDVRLALRTRQRNLPCWQLIAARLQQWRCHIPAVHASPPQLLPRTSIFGIWHFWYDFSHFLQFSMHIGLHARRKGSYCWIFFVFHWSLPNIQVGYTCMRTCSTLINVYVTVNTSKVSWCTVTTIGYTIEWTANQSFTPVTVNCY